ncbi:hypothetical protein KQI48_15230 [Cellulomonas hominis]|uniref:hypothetical protein n=1 Tax=Cellulomonas hominis TaxID=156981 RepID=UPI001C12101B|nr:hypothetical protein [Cellulomonas hominis]MBU5424020.1 hypothetical protein [Cellulomonas hominis]
MPYAVAALVAVITAAVGLAILLEARPNPTGDEPHYLLIAQSIALDGDIDLADDYADPARVAAAYPGNTVLDPVTHAGVYRDGGPMVPIHAIGLPLVLSPVFALGQGWLAARVLMVLISALTAGLAYLVVDRLVPRRPVLGALSVLAVSLTVPGIAFANQVYPEIPAALVLTAAAFCLVRGRPTLPWLVAASVLGALAPWIHLRFAILVLPIGLAVVGRALGMPLGVELRALPAALLRALRERWLRVLAAVSPLLLSAAGILVSNQVLYGSPGVNAAYNPDVFPVQLPFQPLFVWIFGVGSVLDEQRGIAPYAPVVLLVFAAVLVAVWRWRWWALPAVVACVAFYVVTTGVAQGGGFCPPGRWFVVFMPLTAVGLAAALDLSWRPWVVFVPTVLFSWAVTAQLPAHYADLYPVAEVRYQRLPVADEIADAWPDVMVRRQDGLQLEAATLVPGIGRPAGEDDVVAEPADGPGTVVSGPDSLFVPGLYDVTYHVRLAGEPGATVGLGQVLAGESVVAEVPLTVPEAGDGTAAAAVRLDLAAVPTETRVLAFGTGTIEVDRVDVTWAEPAPPGDLERMNGVPLSTVWFAVVALVAGLITAGLTRPARRRTDDA